MDLPDVTLQLLSSIKLSAGTSTLKNVTTLKRERETILTGTITVQPFLVFYGYIDHITYIDNYFSHRYFNITCIAMYINTQ